MWLKEGDLNTKYFHATATNRRRNNCVIRIMDSNEQWRTRVEEVEGVFLEYFSRIYATSRPTQMEQVFQYIERKVDEVINNELIKEFTAEEVKQALMQMNPDKAPALDGMTALFLGLIVLDDTPVSTRVDIDTGVRLVSDSSDMTMDGWRQKKQRR